ncbi:MAG: hypothetical protein R3284_03960 [Rubricoccaceae bacterium]|nr:hypothetical protein [Rubricoccaceae bacterium]
MKRTSLLGIGFLLIGLHSDGSTRGTPSQVVSDTVPDDECPEDLSLIRGRIKFVESFPDCEVKVVESFEDLRVKVVESFPDEPGEWQMVESFPDYEIKIVESFPDFTIRYVDSFPGVND